MSPSSSEFLLRPVVRVHSRSSDITSGSPSELGLPLKQRPPISRAEPGAARSESSPAVGSPSRVGVRGCCSAGVDLKVGPLRKTIYNRYVVPVFNVAGPHLFNLLEIEEGRLSRHTEHVGTLGRFSAQDESVEDVSFAAPNRLESVPLRDIEERVVPWAFRDSKHDCINSLLGLSEGYHVVEDGHALLNIE